MKKTLSKRAPSPMPVYGALLTVQLLFGINYITSKIIVGLFPPLLWATIRVFISGIILMSISILTKRPHPPRNRSFFFPLCLYAFLGISLSQGAFLVGLQHTTATNSAILTTLIPISTLLFVTLSGREPLTFPRLMGFLCAMSGVLVVLRVETFSLSDETLLGNALTIVNCLSYGLFLSLSKKFVASFDSLWTTTWLFLIGSVGLAVVSTPSLANLHWPEMTPQLVSCMLFTILGSTLMAYFLSIWALKQVRSSSVALFIYVQPVVASAIAWIFYDQRPTLRTCLAIVLIFTGMLLALLRKEALQNS
jgi:drug/metabolite transporter (DMT)-like permease